ncbi:hypothetical protein M409DRAFT_67490 [Zasmidium cellare ATCC 36951]|uniref:Xylanolytic transcriptional activator regulatory domain-containing protein n=1 Tax=Zasmidium cellare ATCC 36951 TaxID=1080233 RepID=A0A6A6CH22_ZASCE|nr:uncharacterized protein M409DRAFT_67490 [Zasmidium cellare ATCC 36951]KAF2165242.1 hypothetical protein M409DRAFT_67490 [Zasmidium cellare ATCC 36951]
MSLVFGATSAMADFSHLTDLDDIFTFTANNLLPIATHDGGPRPDTDISSSFQVAEIPPGDSAFLQSQGCFDIPSDAVLYEMVLLYFQWVHPNLPVVIEDQFWARWDGERFQLGDFSLLLLRAMLFASMAQVDSNTLPRLGFTGKREARSAFYRQAKLLFDFGAEKDPTALAQSCLLLRVNSSWLTHTIRFAKIARANSHQRFEQTDPNKARLLKRIWWGVIFRDRILSLGTRRSLQLDLESHSSEEDILTADENFSELGNSPVHHTEAQLRIVQLLSAMCRAMPCIAKATKILYNLEGIDDRVAFITEAKLAATIQSVQHALEALQMWHDETIPIFPFPVSLDGEDAPETLCLYVNMLFIYHSAATFALNVYLLLIYESFPASRSLFDIEDCREALEHANSDVSRRTQEMLQMRVIRYLPISATPLIAPPLILKAINLDIFTRALKSQQERFEGADYCKRGGSSLETPSIGQRNRVKLDWGNLIYKRPQLFLRLMLHLDHALCTGGPPVERDFPPGLRRPAA